LEDAHLGVERLTAFEGEIPQSFAFASCLFSFFFLLFIGAKHGGKWDMEGKVTRTWAVDEKKTGLHREKALFDVAAAAMASTILRLDGHTTTIVSTQQPHRNKILFPSCVPLALPSDLP
jgi:hypothetical protein